MISLPEFREIYDKLLKTTRPHNFNSISESDIISYQYWCRIRLIKSNLSKAIKTERREYFLYNTYIHIESIILLPGERNTYTLKMN